MWVRQILHANKHLRVAKAHTVAPIYARTCKNTMQNVCDVTEQTKRKQNNLTVYLFV